jgi:hypothetical protein
MSAANEIWWRAFGEAVTRLRERATDRKEIDRIAVAEADDALDYASGSEEECAGGMHKDCPTEDGDCVMGRDESCPKL